MMIPLICTLVCTGALIGLAVKGFLAMRTLKTCEARGMSPEETGIQVNRYIKASFSAIALFAVSAAIYLLV